MGISRVVAAVGAALLAACEGGGVAVAAADARAEPKVEKVLEFERMVGVPRPYAGPTGAALRIRGVQGGGLPWVIHEGEAKLLEDGTLTVKVEGLVFDPNDPAVQADPRGLAGTNTVASMKAIVSCLTTEVVDGVLSGVERNVETALFPATTGPASAGGGNVTIRQMLTIPSPCIAPIVFVTSPAGAWFAASGL